MPRWTELKRFCEREGWELYKSTDHFFFRKSVNGNMFYTKVSRGSKEIPKFLWKKILTNQLHVSQEYFDSVI